MHSKFKIIKKDKIYELPFVIPGRKILISFLLQNNLWKMTTQEPYSKGDFVLKNQISKFVLKISDIKK